MPPSRNQIPRHKSIKEFQDKCPPLHSSGTNWRLVASVTHQQLCQLGKCHRYRLSSRPDGSQSRYERVTEVGNPITLRESKCYPSIFQACSLVTNQTELLCSGFGGLEVAYWPFVPKFTAVGFFRAKKFSARLPSELK